MIGSEKKNEGEREGYEGRGTRERTTAEAAEAETWLRNTRGGRTHANIEAACAKCCVCGA